MEWLEAVRNEIDVRYSMVIEDALRGARKPYFNPKKLIKVCTILVAAYGV